MGLLIQGLRVDNVWPPDPEGSSRATVDLRIEGDHIAEIRPRLRPRSDDEVLKAGGATVLPGLHDHHVHLFAWAAASSSIGVSPTEASTPEELARRLRTAPGGPGAWVRAIGYHESTAGDVHRYDLDRLVPDRPVRLQHRSGALWVLNTSALEELGLERDGVGSLEELPGGLERDEAGRLTGRAWRLDGWLRARLAAVGSRPPIDLGSVSRRAAAAGVTGFTDATPDLDATAISAFASAQADGILVQRLHVMTPSEPHGATTEHPGGATTCSENALFSVGAVKLMLDDDQLPSFETFADLVHRTHARGIPVAVHCVTRAQAALTIAVLIDTGARPGDRIEHGAILGPDLWPAVRALGLTVVAQPGFLFSRGDRYIADVEPHELEDLWRVSSLLEAGIPVALSSDAPFGPDDPWTVVRAAAERRTLGGRVLSPAERISARRALSLFCGYAFRPGIPRSVAPGALADVVVIAGSLEDVLAAHAPQVLATVVAGRIVYRSVGG